MGWNYLCNPKLQRWHCWSLGMDKLFYPTLYNGCNYLSMLGLKSNHVSKRGHGTKLCTYFMCRTVVDTKMWKFHCNAISKTDGLSSGTGSTILHILQYSVWNPPKDINVKMSCLFRELLYIYPSFLFFIYGGHWKRNVSSIHAILVWQRIPLIYFHKNVTWCNVLNQYA